MVQQCSHSYAHRTPRNAQAQCVFQTSTAEMRVQTPGAVEFQASFCDQRKILFRQRGNSRCHALLFRCPSPKQIVVNKPFFHRCKPRTAQENPMWYGNTKSLLESVVRGLKTEPPQSEAEWQAQTELVQRCLSEMAEMSGPTVNPANGATSRYVHRPVADKLNRAMPHVRSMLTAMRDRDRTTAMAHGETTLRRL